MLIEMLHEFGVEDAKMSKLARKLKLTSCPDI